MLRQRGQYGRAMPGEIHDEHPFLDPEERREPARRFRGRLSSPVTIVTSGHGPAASGVTVSSIMVAGEAPAHVHLVLGPESRLVDAIRASGRLVVHVVDEARRHLSDVFAGVRPSPGGPFASVGMESSSYGPVIDSLPTRAFCVLESAVDNGDHVLVVGRVEAVEVHDLADPLQWFRGAYRKLEGG